jgi:hypothetical protein
LRFVKLLPTNRIDVAAVVAGDVAFEAAAVGEVRLLMRSFHCARVALANKIPRRAVARCPFNR